MKRRHFYTVVGFQILLLLLMIAYRQYTLSTGQAIMLHLQRPVDPRSMFSGNYVLLSYDISTLDKKKMGIVDAFKYGDTIHVSLSKEGIYWVVKSAGKEIPDTLYIRGTVTSGWSDDIRVEYGIEQYYIPDSQAKEIENKLRAAEDPGEAAVEVIVDSNGNAAISQVLLGNEKLTW